MFKIILCVHYHLLLSYAVPDTFDTLNYVTLWPVLFNNYLSQAYYMGLYFFNSAIFSSVVMYNFQF
jgi:hypothetical protein